MVTNREAGIRGGTAPKHSWTEAERDVVRTLYKQDSKSAQLIADKLGVSFCAVKGQVQTLGLAKRTGRPWWHTNNDEKLKELVPRYSAVTIARMMGCSISSVINRAKRLGLSRRVRHGWYTKRDVCEILGVDHKRVQAFMDSGMLVASYHHGRVPCKNGSGSWHITRESLKRLIRTHPEEFNGRNVDLIQIVQILTGTLKPSARLAKKAAKDNGFMKCGKTKKDCVNCRDIFGETCTITVR